LLKVFVLGASTVAVLGILQNLGINPTHLLCDLKGQRVGSTLGNPDYGTPVMVPACEATLKLNRDDERIEDGLRRVMR